jgi:hypothetical protein
VTTRMITQAEEHSGQYSSLQRAKAAARRTMMDYKRKHRVVLDRTWRNLEERLCWYVCL